MEMNHIHEAIKKIGCLTFTTLEGDSMHSRIISVCGAPKQPCITEDGKCDLCNREVVLKEEKDKEEDKD